MLRIYYSLQFSPEEFAAIKGFGAAVLRFVAAYLLLDGVYVISTAVLKGVGDTRFIMWNIGLIFPFWHESVDLYRHRGVRNGVVLCLGMHRIFHQPTGWGDVLTLLPGEVKDDASDRAKLLEVAPKPHLRTYGGVAS